MVVAMVDGEVTLKRLYRQPPDTIRLQPANSEMAPIFVAGSDASRFRESWSVSCGGTEAFSSRCAP